MRKLFYTAAVLIFILLSGPDVLAQQLTSDCPPEGEVQHWDKIIFNVELDKRQGPVIPPEFLGVNLDLKILDPPETILNLDQEVRNTVASRFSLTSLDADLLQIKIIDVKYQIVTCAFTGPQGPQGLPGADGTNGTNGADGAIGATGPQGLPGADGTNGTNGANGADGATGPQGIPGISGYVRITDTHDVTLFDEKQRFTITCPEGQKVISGGGSFDPESTGVDRALVVESRAPSDTTWEIAIIDYQAAGIFVRLFLTAICAVVQ